MAKRQTTASETREHAIDVPSPAPVAPTVRVRSFSTTGLERPEELFPQATVWLVRETFIDGLLGTVPKRADVYAQYIATRAPMPVPDELATVPDPADPATRREIEEKGWTGFHTIRSTNGEHDKVFLYNYAEKGYCKEVCGTLRNMEHAESKKLPAYKKRINGMMFVTERQVELHLPGTIAQYARLDELTSTTPLPAYVGTDLILPVLERPLRASTPQGERVTVVRSDMCPVGTWCEFHLVVLGVITYEMLSEWFRYGVLGGMGQWRSGGYGRFSVICTEELPSPARTELVRNAAAQRQALADADALGE